MSTPFIGYHQDAEGDWFVVFRIGTRGWYWQRQRPGQVPTSMTYGPYPTAEGAYLAAMKE